MGWGTGSYVAPTLGLFFQPYSAELLKIGLAYQVTKALRLKVECSALRAPAGSLSCLSLHLFRFFTLSMIFFQHSAINLSRKILELCPIFSGFWTLCRRSFSNKDFENFSLKFPLIVLWAITDVYLSPYRYIDIIDIYRYYLYIYLTVQDSKFGLLKMDVQLFQSVYWIIHSLPTDLIYFTYFMYRMDIYFWIIFSEYTYILI